jgi:hypothetical protein
MQDVDEIGDGQHACDGKEISIRPVDGAGD